MKNNENFVLREIDQEYLLIPVREQADVTCGIFKLSETGAYLWNLLATEKEETELVDALVSEYEVDKDAAKKNVKVFINDFENSGIIIK